MDPLTQAALGASLPQAATRKPQQLFIAGLLGFLSGMAADLDVLIRSDQDPLLFLEYHRQFSHSLIFIPLGGLICAAVLHVLLGRRFELRFRDSWLYCTLGYATHGLLDACTTYGTLLLWPFSDQRIAWNVISIIDPLYTLPLLVLIILAGRKRRRAYALTALAWALIYPGIGMLQRDRAIQAGQELAQQRGHQVQRLEAKPSFANLLLWKTVYETDQYFYVDAVRVGRSHHYYPGSRVKKLDADNDFPWLQSGSQQARDLQRFSWFSNGYVALDPHDPLRVGDIRYSLLPNDIAPLWSIELSPQADAQQPVRYVTQRISGADSTRRFWAMLLAEAF